MSRLKEIVKNLHPFVLNKLIQELKQEKKQSNKKTKTTDSAEVNIDTDEVEVLDDIEDVDSVTINIKEKKIGFNRGAEYDEEATDEFDDFAVEVGQLYQTMKDKTFQASSDDKQTDTDAIAQQILSLIDKDTEGDLRTQFEELSKLINSLPDKPTEKEKIGFRQAVNELYMYNKKQ